VISEEPVGRPSSLTQVRLIDLPCHARDDGEVVVAEANSHVPFAIGRMFTVTGPVEAERGKHAHRLCSQFMLCPNGMMDIICDDGERKKTFSLDRSNMALLVPPMIWNTVIFRRAGSVLVVLCDRPYEEHDYIRDYAQFLDR
jgi:hypothetical protein